MTYVIFNFPGSTARVTIKQERIELLGECEEEENFDGCLDEKLGQILKKEVNCSVPWLLNKKNICKVCAQKEMAPEDNLQGA